MNRLTITLSFFLLLALPLPSIAKADDSVNLKQLFTTQFVSGYQPKECGRNIMAFVELAAQKQIPMESASILHITNRGQTELDAVWGLQARGGRGAERWIFHVVLESDGLIFDFDYGNSPNPVPTGEYFRTMFLDAKHLPRNSFVRDPMSDYLVQRVPVSAYLNHLRTGRGYASSDFPTLPIGHFIAP